MNELVNRELVRRKFIFKKKVIENEVDAEILEVSGESIEGFVALQEEQYVD